MELSESTLTSAVARIGKLERLSGIERHEYGGAIDARIGDVLLPPVRLRMGIPGNSVPFHHDGVIQILGVRRETGDPEAVVVKLGAKLVEPERT